MCTSTPTCINECELAREEEREEGRREGGREEQGNRGREQGMEGEEVSKGRKEGGSDWSNSLHKEVMDALTSYICSSVTSVSLHSKTFPSSP